MNMNFYMSARIITGENCVRNNADRFTTLGSKCMIVTGADSAKKSGALDDILSVLNVNDVKYIIYDKIRQNPTVKSCIEAGDYARSFGADYIIGIGGGSPIDASKAIAVVAANPDISEENIYTMKWKCKPLPIIAVGTTAGTGSEVTGVSVLTDANGFKKSFRSDEVYPVYSFGDWRYTMTLSDSFTRSTAVDALAHCIESYFNRNANDISRSFALSGVKKLMKVFSKLLENGTESLNSVDREELYNASLFGGLAISVTGTAFPHALGYFLTENYGIAHGTACAVYLSEFIEYNKKTDPLITEEFFDEIRISDDEFSKIVSQVTPEIHVKLKKDDIDSLSGRWNGNTGLKRCLGDIDTAYINKMLERMFV